MSDIMTTFANVTVKTRQYKRNDVQPKVVYLNVSDANILHFGISVKF